MDCLALILEIKVEYNSWIGLFRCVNGQLQKHGILQESLCEYGLMYFSGEGIAQYYPIIFFPIGILGNVLSFLVRYQCLIFLYMYLAE